jgi:hypothetical protein
MNYACKSQSKRLFHLARPSDEAKQWTPNNKPPTKITRNNQMKKLNILTCTMIALGVMTTAVWAGNPHFIKCSTSGLNSDGTLDVCFKIAGLGKNQTVTVTASADANATYGCLNGGGQCPNAANKVSVSGTVTASGSFTSGKNGQITGCLTIDPPSTTLSCPPGQDLVFVSVSYANASVSAPGANSCDTSSGTFSAEFFPNCP